jgi:hypothetical protein
MKKRTDRLMAFHIDLAVTLARSHGVAFGARALLEQGISFEIAYRVLLQPHLIRGGRARSACAAHESV